MMRNNRLAVAIAAALASVAPLHGASAQQAAAPAAATTGQTELEEVIVTGMRASLETSMDMKRDAIGVVDAISAEDIGKFPDSNLSESLQRITGISIDRRNGEGALVTARGFGAQFNMVTLNGRTMPAADAFAGGNSGDGGIAGAVARLQLRQSGERKHQRDRGVQDRPRRAGNRRYRRHAERHALRGRSTAMKPVMNVGVKAVTDTTNRTGDDITPEVSGIFSFANDDKTLGVGLSASYQKRDSGSSSSTINDWNIRRWTPGNQTTPFTLERNHRQCACDRRAVCNPERHSLSLLRSRARAHECTADGAVRADRYPHAHRGLHVRGDRPDRGSRRPDAVDEREPLQPCRVRYRPRGCDPLVLQEDEGTCQGLRLRATASRAEATS